MPMIMISHLAMNMRQILNMFPSKGGFLAHYNSHIIMSQRNWDYNKHYHVEFGTYVQASQVNYPKNINLPRHLMEFIYDLHLIFRLGIILWTCGLDD